MSRIRVGPASTQDRLKAIESRLGTIVTKVLELIARVEELEK